MHYSPKKCLARSTPSSSPCTMSSASSLTIAWAKPWLLSLSRSSSTTTIFLMAGAPILTTFTSQRCSRASRITHSKYWLLFQAQTTQELSRQHGYFGGTGFSWLKSLGPYTAALGLDTRYERSINTIVSDETYDEVFWRLNNQQSPYCRHLMVFIGVPIIYPRLTLVENGFSVFKTIKLYKATPIPKGRCILQYP